MSSIWFLSRILGAVCFGLASHACAPEPVRPGIPPSAVGKVPPIRGPAAPREGLPIPSLEVKWAPPVVVAGDLAALQAAVSDREPLTVVVGPRFDGGAGHVRIRQLLHTLGTSIPRQILSGNVARLAPGFLPLDREAVELGARPRYRSSGIAADRRRLSDMVGPDTRGALLVIDDAAIDVDRWNALPAAMVGSCDPVIAALATGQEQSLAILEPFLDRADGALAEVYRSELAARLPGLVRELEGYRRVRTRDTFADEPSWQRHECGHAFWEYVQNFARCEKHPGGCSVAPRLFLIDGLRIGTAEPTQYIPEGCAAAVGKDYIGELRRLAGDVVWAVVDRLDPKWTTLADRLATITEVHAALVEVCTPRRRRFAPADVEHARRRLARIGELLGSADPPVASARWRHDATMFHVPGIGPVRQVARFVAGHGSVSEHIVAETRAFREHLLSAQRCLSARDRLPIAVLVLDASSGSVGFLGFFYEEELFCDDLAPIRDDATGAATH